MFFTEYGTFTGETCPYCKKSDTYLFTKKTENRAFLFFTLGTKSKKYYKRCTNCGDSHEVDRIEASSIIDHNFYQKDKKEKIKNTLQALIPYVVLVAIVLGVVAIERSSNEHAIKRALANEPDGIYYVYNEDSNYIATVSIADSVLTYDMFAKYDYIDADDYDNVLEDQVEISYYNEIDGKLKMCTETDSCVVIDRRNVYLQHCFYDPEQDEQFYYWGVKNLDDITYIDENNAIYPYEYYDENNEAIQYKMHYKKTPQYWIELYFVQDENMQYVFSFLDVYYTDNDYVVGYAGYDCSTSDVISDLVSQSSLDDIVTTLEENNIIPAVSYDYTLFSDTHIIESWQCEQYDGIKTITSSASNSIKKIGKYYIVVEGEIIMH